MVWIWVISLLLRPDWPPGPGDPAVAAEQGDAAVVNSRTPGPVEGRLTDPLSAGDDAGARPALREPVGVAARERRAGGFGVVGDEDDANAGAAVSLRQLFDAIRRQESGGEPRGGRDAVGDDGHALGPYQIWRPYWQDATESDDQLGGRYEDVRDPAYAERVMMGYWKRYCPEALEDPTRLENLEVLARVHNGGPQGATSPGTLGYWEQVKGKLGR